MTCRSTEMNFGLLINPDSTLTPFLLIGLEHFHQLSARYSGWPDGRTLISCRRY